MGRLRLTYVVEYDVDPEAYGVQTMEEAAAEDLAALDYDFVAVIASLGDDGAGTYKIEVV